MRVFYIILFTFFFCIPVMGQLILPNSDFENWVPLSTPVNYEEPQYWSTSNRFTCSIGCGGGFSVLKTPSGYSGYHAAKLMTVLIGYSGEPYAAFMVNGEAAYDDMYMVFDFSKSGTPISSRPSFLSGYYIYEAWEARDSAHISVYLTKYNIQAGQRDTIGLSEYKLGPENSFTYFKAPVQYFVDLVIPDTIISIIYSSDPHNPMENAILTVDMLQLGYSNGIYGLEGEILVNMFPNPATEAMYIQMNSPDTHIDSILITDLKGSRVAAAEDISKPIYRIDLTNIEKGCYIIEIQLNDGNIYIKKFIRI